MKKLAVCIPNYNRAKELSRLLKETARQISKCGLYENVEICVSDDFSTEDISLVVEEVKAQYPKVYLNFHINDKNLGMDFNFLKCVQMSDAEYCWIIGNDDIPEENGIKSVLKHLEEGQEKVDVLVGPFDVYDENSNVLRTICPLRTTGQECLIFHTGNEEEYSDLLERVNDGNAIFCFLSNVVFRREDWVKHGDMFEDKMQSIFIQMYMNLQTLGEGAVYKYVPTKFIKNYVDDEVNATLKRECDVLIGLSGVVDYFFKGKIHRKLQECIVDGRIYGRMWDLPDGSEQKQLVLNIKSPKNELYRQYFIPSEKRKAFFHGKDVLIYGAGTFGNQAIKELRNYDVDSTMVFDADMNKWGKDLAGCEIHSVDDLYSQYCDEKCVVVANNSALIEIIEMLHSKGIEKIAIIT